MPEDKGPGRPALLPLSAPKPGCPDWHDGEWLCIHPPCPVRTVVLRVRFGGPFRLPRLRCPLCLRSRSHIVSTRSPLPLLNDS